MEIPMKDKDNKEIPEISDDMPKQRKLPVWVKIVIGVVAALAVVIGIAYGVFSYNYSKIYVKNNDNEKAQKEYFDQDTGIEDLKEIDPDKIHLDSADSVSQSKDVINILVCGEEAIGGGHRRRPWQNGQHYDRYGEPKGWCAASDLDHA